MSARRPAARAALAALLLLGALSSAPDAVATPAMQTVTAEVGMVAYRAWSTCDPKEVSFVTNLGSGAVAKPVVGSAVTESLSVVGFRREGSAAIWSIAPNPLACSLLKKPPPVDLISVQESFRLQVSAKRWVLRVAKQNGVRSIAGWRVDHDAPSQYPRASSARRAFGKPTSTRRDGSRCTLAWTSMALKVVFRRDGNGSPCKSGLALRAFVSDPTKWAVQVGKHPAIIESSDPDYLRQRRRSGAASRPNWWSFNDVELFFGDGPRFQPPISGHAGADGQFDRYELWMEAGGLFE